MVAGHGAQGSSLAVFPHCQHTLLLEPLPGQRVKWGLFLKPFRRGLVLQGPQPRPEVTGAVQRS